MEEPSKEQDGKTIIGPVEKQYGETVARPVEEQDEELLEISNIENDINSFVEYLNSDCNQTVANSCEATAYDLENIAKEVILSVSAR